MEHFYCSIFHNIFKSIGLPIGFFLLRYSVLLTVESLSLLYLLVISDLYVLGDDALIS